eukprot:6569201-Prorocentrum_lima.AAC.1
MDDITVTLNGRGMNKLADTIEGMFAGIGLHLNVGKTQVWAPTLPEDLDETAVRFIEAAKYLSLIHI